MKPSQQLVFCAQSDLVTECDHCVVSLSEARDSGHLEAITDHLIALLKDLYDSSITVHNDMISRSRVSVLSELTMKLNVYFDLVPQELRSCILTPFAMYGGSAGQVYGKDILQRRNRHMITEREPSDLLASLQQTPFQLWCYHHNPKGSFDVAHPLIGPEQASAIPIVGVITRAGKMTRESGYYSGWPVNFEGFWFLACGYRHDEQTVEIVKRKSERVQASSSEGYWSMFELMLVHLLVDPLGSRYRSANQLARHDSEWRNEYKPRRKEVLNRVREAVELEFDENRALTPHAQIALLTESESERAEFVERVAMALEDVILANRGLRSSEKPVVLADILALYCMDEQGVLKGTEGLSQHPVAVLLLEDKYLEHSPVDRMSPISDAVRWARTQPEGHPAAAAILQAWKTYRQEQYWLAVHGFSVGTDLNPEPEIQAYGKPGYMSDIWAVFDDRFLDTPVARLASRHKAALGRFMRGYARSKTYREDALLRDLPTYDFALRYDGVGDKTMQAVFSALLEHGREWRWLEAGLDFMSYRGAGLKGEADASAAASLQAGLDELADLFG